MHSSTLILFIVEKGYSIPWPKISQSNVFAYHTHYPKYLIYREKEKYE